MSFLGTQKRSQVLSVRLTDERKCLLDRIQATLSEELGQEVSASDALFLALERRTDLIDRATKRLALLKAPTESLWNIRKRWESEHYLTAPEWDALAYYVSVGLDEEDRQLKSRVSRDSYLAILDAFEVAYTNRRTAHPDAPLSYIHALTRNFPKMPIPEVNHESSAAELDKTVMWAISTLRQRLNDNKEWCFPGPIGHCLSQALLMEGFSGEDLTRLLGKYWTVLWRLAARGHWLHEHKPVRPASLPESDFRKLARMPEGLTSEDKSIYISFLSGGGELGVFLNFNGVRRFAVALTSYPDLLDFRHCIEIMGGFAHQIGGTAPFELLNPAGIQLTYLSHFRWCGNFLISRDDNSKWGVNFNTINSNMLYFELSNDEVPVFRELLRRMSENPELQAWFAELDLEYGEYVR